MPRIKLNAKKKEEDGANVGIKMTSSTSQQQQQHQQQYKQQQFKHKQQQQQKPFSTRNKFNKIESNNNTTVTTKNNTSGTIATSVIINKTSNKNLSLCQSKLSTTTSVTSTTTATTSTTTASATTTSTNDSMNTQITHHSTTLNEVPDYIDSDDDYNNGNTSTKFNKFANNNNNDDDDKDDVITNQESEDSEDDGDSGFRDFSADLVDLVRVNDVESIQEGLENFGPEKFAKFSVASDSRGLSALTLAAELNRVEIVKLMIEAIREICANDDDVRKIETESETTSKPKNPIDTANEIGGWTALHCACSNDNLEIVELLLNCGADPNVKDGDGMTALHFASDRGCCHIVEALLRRGSSIDELTTNESYSALYLAGQMGHWEVVEKLLAAGAREDLLDRDGWNVLHAACNRNHIRCVRVLLRCLRLRACAGDGDIRDDGDGGGDVGNESNKVAPCGEQNGFIVDNTKATTAEHRTNKLNEQHVRLYKLVNCRANDGVTPLYLAAQHGYSEIISELLSHNADSNIRENDGFGPLQVACQSGHLETVSVLLSDRNCDVNASTLTDTKWKPLHFAVHENHQPITELLIKRGANVNSTSSGGHTALHVASERGYVECVSVLLRLGRADVELVDENGWTALHHATQNGCVDVVEEILRYFSCSEKNDGGGGCEQDEDSEATSKATESTSQATTSDQISNPMNNSSRRIVLENLINKRTNDGESVALIAVINGHVNVLEVLRKYGATLANRKLSRTTEIDESKDDERREHGDKILLHAACQASNAQMVRYLLENDVELNARDANGWTPLHFLAENDSIDCLETILTFLNLRRDDGAGRESIFDTETSTPIKNIRRDSTFGVENTPSPIFNAAFTLTPYDDDRKIMSRASLTSQKSTSENDSIALMELDSQTNEGHTATFIAAHNRSVNVLRRLLTLGARADLVNHLGWSALHAASEVGWTDGVQILLSAPNVDVNRKTYHGFTALYLATQENRIDTVQFLLTVVFADPNLSENQGFCPLHVAAQKGFVTCIELLLNNGALANKTDGNGWTCLHLAVQEGHLTTIQTLLEHGVDVDAQTADGVTSLMMSVLKLNVQALHLLLQHGARTDVYDRTTGHSPLHVASKLANLEIIEELLNAGANIEAETRIDRLKPLHIAMRIARDEELTAEPVVRALLNEGADTSPAVNCGGLSPLHTAAQKGWNTIAKLLLDHGALIDLPDDAGWTPLMFACRYGRVDTVKLLLTNGAKPNIKTEKGRERIFSLMLAVQSGYIEVVEVLVMWSCDVNAVSEEGTTVLYWAAQCGDLDVVQLLLFNGADPNIRDRKGFIPLHPACLNGHYRVAKSLVKAGSDVDVPARDGTRPIQLAERNGHEEIVEWLMKQEGAKDPAYEDNFGLGSVFGQWGAYLKNVVAKMYGHSLDEYERLAGEDDVTSRNESTSENRYVTIEKVDFSSSGGGKQIKPKKLSAVNISESARKVYKV